MLREFARAHQRRAADGRLRDVAFRQRQKLGVAPHIERAAREILAPHGFLKGIVVKGNFQGGETVFAEGPRGIAPSLAAFFTSQFVEIGHMLPSRWHASADCTRRAVVMWF